MIKWTRWSKGKATQYDAGYTTDSATSSWGWGKKAFCSNCKHYLGGNECELVSGIIRETGYCSWHEN